MSGQKNHQTPSPFYSEPLEKECSKDATQKKTSLRMTPCGLYLLTAETSDGKTACSTINFVTQTSFEPPLIVAGVKNDSLAHSIIKR